MYSDVMKTTQCVHPLHHHNGFLVTCRLWTPTRKLCIHFVYKNFTRCIQLMCTKCMQNLSKMYTTFRENFVYILSSKSKELCQLNFIYKMYTKIGWNLLYILYTHILYTFCIQKFVEMWDIFCIQTFYIHSL